MGQGLFCANSYSARGHWTACQAAWCGKCYTATEGDQFAIKIPQDEEGYSLLIDKDKDRFLTARSGDHFVCAFQCDLCQFRNVYGRDPVCKNFESKDMVLRCIRRATLDAFWARESSAVIGNGREVRKIAAKGAMLGLPLQSLFPALGPFPVPQGCARYGHCVLYLDEVF
jgi:hypothetical protein